MLDVYGVTTGSVFERGKFGEMEDRHTKARIKETRITREKLGFLIWWHKIVVYFILVLICAIGLGIGLNKLFPPEVF